MEEYLLIEHCLAGDYQAQKALYDKHKDSMMGLCMRYAKSKEEAQDFLQEGFIKVFRDLHQYRPDKPLAAWIRKVMVNTALEHIRKSRKERALKHPLTAEELAHQFASNPLTQQHNLEYLVLLIQQLPTDYQVVFNLFVVEGYSHKEIAQLLDIKIGTSKVRLVRARARLKKQLAVINQNEKVI